MANSTNNYTVLSGDTMTSIANQFGTTLSNLLSLNPQITNVNALSIGQVITVPTTPDAPTTIPSNQSPFFICSPAQIIALTAYGENRSGGIAGMQSVINVIQNRRLQIPITLTSRFGDYDIWKATGSSYHAVCLKDKQFSCFNIGD